MNTEHLDPTELANAYEAGTSAAKLARSHGVSVWSVITRLRRAGVEVRTPTAQNERRLGASLSQELSYRDIVDGLLLGDGSIGWKNNLRLQQSDKRFGWLLQVQEHLRLVGATCSLLPRPPQSRVLRSERRVISGGPSHLLYTPAYVENQSEKARWYPADVKAVPRDLFLTPTVLLHWFCGDGTYDGAGHLTFCTQCFTKDDVDFLVHCLQRDLCIFSCRQKTQREGQYTIALQRHEEAMKLKAFLEPLIDSSCLYKLRFVRHKKRLGQFSDNEVRKIRKLREAGATTTSLAEKFEVSITAISNIINRKVYKEVT